MLEILYNFLLVYRANAFDKGNRNKSMYFQLQYADLSRARFPYGSVRIIVLMR